MSKKKDLKKRLNEEIKAHEKTQNEVEYWSEKYETMRRAYDELEFKLTFYGINPLTTLSVVDEIKLKEFLKKLTEF